MLHAPEAQTEDELLEQDLNILGSQKTFPGCVVLECVVTLILVLECVDTLILVLGQT